MRILNRTAVLVLVFCLSNFYFADQVFAKGYEKEITYRYSDLKKRYENLEKNGVNLSQADELVKQIKLAKKHKDYQQLDLLLTKIEDILNQSEISVKSQQNAISAPKYGMAKDFSVPKSANLTQQQILFTLLNNPNFRQLAAYKGNPKNIDDSGAAGRNIKKFSDVAAQREAGWVLLKGIHDANPYLVEKAVRAIEYAFNKQTPEGNFENGQGVDARTAINADTFFLQAFAQCYWILKGSPFEHDFMHRLDALKPKLNSALLWLSHNTDEMYRQDRHTANRLAFDALAFTINGQILNNPHLNSLGVNFLKNALSLQMPDGTFKEKGGYDSSYQAVSLMNLQIAWTYLDDPLIRQQVFESISTGMQWMKSRILPSGEVSAQGNTRTGLGQEKFFGKVKEINYGEVTYAFFMWSVLANDQEAGRLAPKVLRYGLQQG
jgi:hypothetical protein